MCTLKTLNDSFFRFELSDLRAPERKTIKENARKKGKQTYQFTLFKKKNRLLYPE